MNQFLHKMGMPKLWAMTDVYGLDDMLLDMLPQPVVALMLLFPINDKVHLKYFPVKVCLSICVSVASCPSPPKKLWN